MDRSPTAPSSMQPGRTSPPDGEPGPPRVPEVLDSFLRAVPRRGAALAVVGDAGSGRSRTLTHAGDAARARGLTVVGVAGTRADTDVPHGVLDRLLDRLRMTRPAGATVLPAPREEAPGDDDEVTAPLRAAVRRAAVAAPVLLVVDDLHLVDEPTRQVLRALVRTLAGGGLPGVGLLTATDPATAAVLAAPSLTLPPLTPSEARSVLAATSPGLAPQVVERVVQEAVGNPLALAELPASLTEEQAQGTADLPPELTLSHRLAAPFRDRVAEVDAPTREVLLLVALHGTGSPIPAVPVSRDSLPQIPLRQALATGLLSPGDGGTVRFAHPVARLTVLARSTAEERHRAHLWWATSETDDVRRTWHRAAARLGADAGLSASLARVARVHLDRDEVPAAVTALARAAELDPDPAGRSRLLAEAAYVAIVFAGDQDRTAALLARALEDTGQAGRPAHALLAAAHRALHADGDVAAAQRGISAALRGARQQGGDDPGALSRALAGAVELDALAMRPGRGDAGRAPAGTPAEARSLRLLAGLSDPTGADVPDRGELDAAIADLAGESDATVVLRVAGAVLSADRLDECRSALLRVAAAGDGPTHVTATMLLAMGDQQAGRWAEAARRCEEGLALVGPRGDRLRLAQFRCVSMMLAASRGDTDEVRRTAHEIGPWAVHQGAQALVIWCRLAQGLAAVAHADFEAAFAHARAVAGSRPGGVVGRATWGSLDLVESALRTGRPDVAADHVRHVLHDDLSRLSPRVAIVLPACQAMTTAGDGAADLFAEALSAPALPQWPFEHARVRLAHGEWLRRGRARRAARAELAVAVDLFTALGAHAWVRRAEAEHRATASSPRAPSLPGHPPGPALTPQERQVAGLAASGLSNGDIAAQLLLSPKTVATHLSHTFRKLGIGSRAALREALGPDGAPPAPPRGPAS